MGGPSAPGGGKAALGEGRGGVVGITTGLFGAGGFGKTTLAKMACADSQVRETFSGGVYLVTVGRDLRGQAAIAGKVNDVIKLVTGQDATLQIRRWPVCDSECSWMKGHSGCSYWTTYGNRRNWPRSHRVVEGAPAWSPLDTRALAGHGTAV